MRNTLKKVFVSIMVLAVCFTLGACGAKKGPQSIVLQNDSGYQLQVTYDPRGVTVKETDDGFVAKTKTGTAYGRLVPASALETETLNHYEDIDFFSFAIGGNDAIGYGGESSDSTSIVHIVKFGSACLRLESSSQDALYAAEMYLTFENISDASESSTEEDFPLP